MEIGGPSDNFSPKSIVPVYRIAGSVDNCNFAAQTIWSSSIGNEHIFSYQGKELGRQFICEGTQLEGIADDTYDFLISSHTLEHIANPIKALHEWKRVIKDGGMLLLLLPHKERTFDHWRPVTDLGHLIKDYEMGVNEDDMTHLSEILELHDLSMTPEVGTWEEVIERSNKNFENRCLHHHVFTTESAIRVVDYVGFKILSVVNHSPHHIILFCQKTSSKMLDVVHAENALLLGKEANWRALSCFESDRIS